jgi:hypothetical protein
MPRLLYERDRRFSQEVRCPGRNTLRSYAVTILHRLVSGGILPYQPEYACPCLWVNNAVERIGEARDNRCRRVSRGDGAALLERRLDKELENDDSIPNDNT